MRALSAVLAVVTVLGAAPGCTAYLKSQSRTKSARREAVDIALGGVSQLIVGGLIAAGSFYWFNHTKQNPEPISEEELPPGFFPMASLLLGSGIVISGVADGTIGLYQGMSNDHLFASPPPPGVKPLPGYPRRFETGSTD